MFPLSEEQIRRYARHIVLPGVGGRGQRRLLQSRVLLIGVGGLGSPIALYLAAAGVGTIGIIDPDVVDLSNLQRQVLFRTEDLGRPSRRWRRWPGAASGPEPGCAGDPLRDPFHGRQRPSAGRGLRPDHRWER
jgi:hypothetical protein